MNLFEDAVVTYCEGGNYDSAAECARLIKNPELHGKLMDYVDRKRKDTIVSSRDPWAAIKQGDIETAC
jgi:hypothetical protein